MATKKSITDFVIVQEYLKSIAGDYANELVKICENKKEGVSDEYLGKKIPIKITEIRAVLNKLHYQGIAAYTKTKDNKSGWYYYNWIIHKDRVIELIVEKQKEALEKLKQKQSMALNYDFFACPNLCEEIQFEVAAEYKFKCPKCGKAMDLINSKKSLKMLNEKVCELENELVELQEMMKK